MDAARLAQVREIFLAARKVDGAERAKLLEALCGDDAVLSHEVKSLLRQPTDDFFPDAVTESVASGDLWKIAATPMPQFIGPFRIVERLGEGGMGIVYKAEQRSPVKRMVALKLIKPGFDTAEVIARFESERQALARMDHPSIAKVLNAGADDFGRPYFVMEFVPGTSITRFADDNRLPITKRLELFMEVCNAISHAHTKAIIHRDIKPSNVLAYIADGKAVVRVIDFGVAKALTGDRLSDRTFNTQRGQAIGTYESMSPEQADGSPDIDTRTDVYALGVLLYELLSGGKPFERETFANAADGEIRRVIREVEPPRPSTRLSSMGEAGTKIAAARRAQLDALANQLQSELEWIPLMAMRKERDRRYASALELADDVRNYLENRPLRAGPESIAYRLRKHVSRNKAALGAAAAIIMLLVGGIIATSWQASRATRAEAKQFVLREQAQKMQRAAEAEVTATRHLLIRTGAQHLLEQGRLRGAFEQAESAFALDGSWEDRALLGDIVDAARAQWSLVASVVPASGREPTPHPNRLGLLANGCFAGPGSRYLTVPTISGLDLYALPECRLIGCTADKRRTNLVTAVGSDRVAAVVERAVRIYTVPDLRPIAEFSVSAEVAQIIVDPAADHAAVLCADGQVTVWSLPRPNNMSTTLPATQPADPTPIAQAMFKPWEVGGGRIGFSPSGGAILFGAGRHTDPYVLWPWRQQREAVRYRIQAHLACFGENDRQVVGYWTPSQTYPDPSLDIFDLASTTADAAVKVGHLTGLLPGPSVNEIRTWRANVTNQTPTDASSAVEWHMATLSPEAIDLFSMSSHLSNVRFTSLLPHRHSIVRPFAFDGRAGLLCLNDEGRLRVFQLNSVLRVQPGHPLDNLSREWPTTFWNFTADRDAMWTAELRGQGPLNRIVVATAIPFDGGPSNTLELEWDAPNAGCQATPWGMSITPDGRFLAVVWQEGKGTTVGAEFTRKRVLLYLLKSREGRAETGPLAVWRRISLDKYSGSDPRASHQGFRLHSNGQTVLVRSNTAGATIYRVEDGTVVTGFDAGPDTTYSPDGSLLIGGGARPDDYARVWDAATGRLLFTTPRSGTVQRAAISSDNRMLYVGWKEGTMEAYTLAGPGASSGPVREWKTRVAPVAISSKGDRFIGFSPDEGNTGTMVLASLETGATLMVLNLGAFFRDDARYAPDGNSLAILKTKARVELRRPPTPDRARQALERKVAPVLDVTPNVASSHAQIVLEPSRWHLDVTGTAQGTQAILDDTMVVEVTEVDGTNWHVQIQQGALALAEGAQYGIKFNARADMPHKLGVFAGQGADPFGTIGLSKEVSLGGQWREYEERFTAKNAQPGQSRVAFVVGSSRGKVYIKDVKIVAY
jgi:serine/threonine protein kinase